MDLKIFQVDSFTDRTFHGNPAGVCLLDREIGGTVMQNLAMEMNLSETAFIYPAVDDGSRRLRWFTPTMEVPLCGHATLASAHILFTELDASDPIRFRTLSGALVVHREEDSDLRMDFPAGPSRVREPPAGLLDALGISPRAPCRVSDQVWLVRMESEDEVATLSPDYPSLGAVDLGGQAIGVVVTAPATHSPVDVVSRFFAPWAGVDEDPVTGLGHTVLGPYWAGELDRDSFQARQISYRPGDVLVRMEGNRVHLTGSAVTVLRGAVTLP